MRWAQWFASPLYSINYSHRSISLSVHYVFSWEIILFLDLVSSSFLFTSQPYIIVAVDLLYIKSNEVEKRTKNFLWNLEWWLNERLWRVVIQSNAIADTSLKGFDAYCSLEMHHRYAIVGRSLKRSCSLFSSTAVCILWLLQHFINDICECYEKLYHVKYMH